MHDPEQLGSARALPITRPAAAEPVSHGGDLDAARERYPGAPEPWIDLSTALIPSLPDSRATGGIWSRLPARSEEEALLAAAAARYRPRSRDDRRRIGHAGLDRIASPPRPDISLKILRARSTNSMRPAGPDKATAFRSRNDLAESTAPMSSSSSIPTIRLDGLPSNVLRALQRRLRAGTGYSSSTKPSSTCFQKTQASPPIRRLHLSF